MITSIPFALARQLSFYNILDQSKLERGFGNRSKTCNKLLNIGAI